MQKTKSEVIRQNKKKIKFNDCQKFNGSNKQILLDLEKIVFFSINLQRCTIFEYILILFLLKIVKPENFCTIE